MTDVTLILPNYAPDDQVAQRALEFLTSLDSSLPTRVPLITIDNGTQEDTQPKSQLLGRLRRDSTFYIHYDNPLGYARAVNIGLALAETEYVVVLNNDLTLPQLPSLVGGEPYYWSWLHELINVYEKDTGAGPGVLSAMDYPCPPILYDDSWYSLWMSDRQTLAQIGYLDESLPFRFHDQDFNIRMYKAGFKVQRTGKVVVGHDEGTTYKKMVGVDEDKERQRMIARYGAATYVEWRALGGRPLGK